MLLPSNSSAVKLKKDAVPTIFEIATASGINRRQHIATTDAKGSMIRRIAQTAE